MYGHPKLVTFPQGQKFHAGTNVKLRELFLIGNDRKFFYPRRKGRLENSHSSFEVLWMWLYADVRVYQQHL